MSSTAKTISGEELDRKFDDGENILDYLDLEYPIVEHHPPLQKRVTLTMPAWMIEGLDKEADDLAVSRNAVVNTWIAERLRATQQTELVTV